jgi:DoxX-like protein
MRTATKTNVGLWILQGFLALFFALASGAPKLFLPMEMIPMPLPLPELFVRCIGVAEVCGALGLILPGILRIQPRLTVLAAACLVALTICAAVYQLAAHQPESAVFALVIGLLAACVAYGRARLAPLTNAEGFGERRQQAGIAS